MKRTSRITRTIASAAAAIMIAFTPVGTQLLNAGVVSYAASYAEELCPSIECKMTTENSVIYKAVKSSFASRSYYTVFHSMAMRRSAGFTSYGQYIQTEAEYGVTIAKDDNPDKSKRVKTMLYVNAYNYTEKGLKVKSAELEGLGNDNDMKREISVGFDAKKLDTSKLHTGLYRITVKFSNGKSAEIFFYKVTGNAAPCVCEKLTRRQLDTLRERRNALKKAMEKGGVARDGSNSIALDMMYYPNYNFDSRYRCDTALWENLSDSLVKSGWSQEHKAYVIYDWVLKNIAYDEYKVRIDETRTSEANDWSGKYHVWNTKTGVCWDFTNILAIMFRQQGIPTTSIYSKSKNHVWNAAYINNRWVELDASSGCKYTCYEKDYTKRTASTSDHCMYRYDFTTYPNGSTGMPSDAIAGGYLMYGDPDDPDSYTHYVY